MTPNDFQSTNNLILTLRLDNEGAVYCWVVRMVEELKWQGASRDGMLGKLTQVIGCFQ